jgi:hypothetical protein
MSILAHYLGLNDPSGPIYLFWSGFGSDLGEVTLVAALVGLFRSHNCAVTGCIRTRTFPVAGSPWKACRKHHPHIDESNVRITPGRIATFGDRHPEVRAV